MKTFPTLVLNQKSALLDTSLLDEITNPSNPLKLGKKGSLIRKDESVCNYYWIDANARFTNIPTWHHQRFNELFNAAQFKGYHYVVILNC